MVWKSEELLWHVRNPPQQFFPKGPKAIAMAGPWDHYPGSSWIILDPNGHGSKPWYPFVHIKKSMGFMDVHPNYGTLKGFDMF